MDLVSLIGLILGACAVLIGSILKGSTIAALWNAGAFMIVVVGTCAAIMVQTRFKVLSRAGKMLPWIIRPPQHDHDALIAKIVEWSDTARRQGLLGLEGSLETESDNFAKKGLQLLVDGSEPDAIRRVLEVELTAKEESETKAAQVFEGMGGYSPTMGIIGAVLGLMAVMEHLAEPSKLGAGIAAAFVSTIYGIALANLAFLPIANKLKSAISAQTELREMTIEGLISIAQGDNPRNIETKLKGYLQ
jgi:chemotaxis protein MotA